MSFLMGPFEVSSRHLYIQLNKGVNKVQYWNKRTEQLQERELQYESLEALAKVHRDKIFLKRSLPLCVTEAELLKGKREKFEFNNFVVHL